MGSSCLEDFPESVYEYETLQKINIMVQQQRKLSNEKDGTLVRWTNDIISC